VTAILQFFVLFAGPIGVMLLLGFLVTRWGLRSLRRAPAAPHLEVIPGAAERADGTSGEPPSQEGRPPLRLVDHASRAAHRNRPGSR
jgi:hypothetical protein